MTLLSTDPVGLRLTADGDLDRSSGGLRLARGIDGVVQGVRVRMLLVRGEWFLNLAAGVPYLERPGVPAADALLGRRFSEAKALAAFRRPILATPGVAEVLALAVAFDRATRELAVTWSARTVFGDTPLDLLRVPA